VKVSCWGWKINQSTDLVIVWDLDEEKVEVVEDGNNIAYHYLCCCVGG
jgi:hypothetical protein